ncbi:MAG: N-formylglutamate amidohydrolase [Geminicoccaceae bacterium]
MHGLTSAPYSIVATGRGPTPVVLSSPHSGRHYPAGLLDQLRVGAHVLRAFEDGPLDELLLPACRVGAVLVAARYARAVVDLNRDATELDPEALPVVERGNGLRATLRARAGLGVVPTRLGGQPIYRGALRGDDLELRLRHVHLPYHAELDRLLDERRGTFGVAVLLDVHSMPTAGLAGPETGIDVSLGDRYGRACDASLVDAVELVLVDAGLKVARNRPYAGGYITERHGRSDQNRHALQIELRRGLFMDETSHRVTAGATAIADLLARVVAIVLDRAAGLGFDAADGGELRSSLAGR